MLGLQGLRNRQTKEEREEAEARAKERADDPYRKAFNVMLDHQRSVMDEQADTENNERVNEKRPKI